MYYGNNDTGEGLLIQRIGPDLPFPGSYLIASHYPPPRYCMAHTGLGLPMNVIIINLQINHFSLYPVNFKIMFTLEK